MKYDARVEERAKDIVHEVQVAHNIHLNDTARHYIFTIARKIADYWKKQLEIELEQKNALKFNETRLWIMRNQPDNYEALEAIKKISEGKSIR